MHKQPGAVDELPLQKRRDVRNVLDACLRQAPLALFSVAIVIFTWRYIADGLTSWFSNDDLMNLHYYWARSWGSLLEGVVAFWDDSYRPVGGLFYRVLYAVWGLTPAPFQLAAFAFLAADFILLYLTVHRLTRSRAAAAIALTLFVPNASFALLWYDSGMVYDVLAFFFFYLAFWLYVHARERGAVVGWLGVLGFLVLYVFAFQAKEVAISLPLVVGLYELLWRPVGGLRRWACTVLGGLVGAAFVIGKSLNPQSHFHGGEYVPHYSVMQYVLNTAGYFQQLFYFNRPIPEMVFVGVLVAMVTVALASRRRGLMWAAGFALVGVLPLAFVRVRAGYAFFVPAVAWVVYLSALVEWGISRIAPLRWRSAALAAAVVVIFVAAAPLHDRTWNYVLPRVHGTQQENADAANSLRRAMATLPRGSRVFFKNDPFSRTTYFSGNTDYRMIFLADLLYNDHDQQVYVAQLNYLEPQGNYDVVIDYVNGQFVRVR